MINDVGKTTAIVRLNDFVINMVNATIDSRMTGGIQVYDDDGETLRYTLSIDSSGVDARCLMFARSFTGDSIDSLLRPVLYVPPSVEDVQTSGVTCIPLYECISPSAAMLVNGNYQLTWWTNFDSAPSLDVNGRYSYDYSAVHKFRTSELGDVTDNATACKALCTAPIHWERLKMEGYDDRVYTTPVIRDIAVLACVAGEGYIVDFSTGGSGGGVSRMHSHINNSECGFAAAVFMPSATPRVMSWS